MNASSLSLIVFSAITGLYFIIKHLLVDVYNDPNAASKRKVFLIIYIIAVIASQYSSNISTTKEICGVVQPGPAFLMTFIPNIIMFGTLIILFTFFPGWKAPFSNTFGYFVTWLGGVRHVFVNMLVPKKGGKLIQEVYDDPSLMINEITPSNFKTYMDEMKRNGILEKGASTYFSKLYKFVTLKDSISEWMWYMLVGSLVITTSYNALAEIQCKKTPSSMMDAHNKWTEEQNNIISAPPPKIYNTRE